MLHIIPRPCGHSYSHLCGCAGSGTSWTSTGFEVQIYNGLCECRGPLNRHPFHAEPLEPEYVGKHRTPVN
jgi:hypothetical protein